METRGWPRTSPALASSHERRALAVAALLSLAAAAAPLALGAGLAAWPLHLAAALLLRSRPWPAAPRLRGGSAAFGGLTGDVYGALNELLEVVLLLVLLLLQHNLM
ncbi:adenosylcobinamide-GDP ribazoletransferase [Paenibacillus sp. FSL H7-0323]|uniref:adenosylcobinamide-GDP ribazoletransferase n=1 Tax=Paenibacillus sp. FSL H7-0323 TaxID=2921433 RepID=UPI0040474493